jgi:hypothetical protein
MSRLYGQSRAGRCLLGSLLLLLLLVAPVLLRGSCPTSTQLDLPMSLRFGSGQVDELLRVLLEGRRLCTSALVNSIPKASERVLQRYAWATGAKPLSQLDALLSAHAKLPKQVVKDPGDGSLQYVKDWSGLDHDHVRFNFMGPVTMPCPTLTSYGNRDEEKRICVTDELKRPGCSVFSVGSNNLWCACVRAGRGCLPDH